jgi:hypothetical protein
MICHEAPLHRAGEAAGQCWHQAEVDRSGKAVIEAAMTPNYLFNKK